jgi:predicted DNA-binding transcriptional regulator YafY
MGGVPDSKLSGMPRQDRLHALIQTLRDGRLHRAADLARAQGVSDRTIWRDMATLVASGLPIEGEPGLGYVLRLPVTLPPMVVTGPELAALRAGLAAVAGGADAGLARAARTLAAKIGTVTPLAGDDLFDPLAEDIAPARHLPLIRAAIRGRGWLAVTHVGPDGAEEALVIRPLALALDDRLRVVKAVVRGEASPRALRLDRMLAVAEG